MVCGLYRCSSLSAAHLVASHTLQGQICHPVPADRMLWNAVHPHRSAISSRVIPPTRLTVFVKVFVNDTPCEIPIASKILRSLIRLDGGNTHLGRNLDDAVQDRAVVIIHCRIIILVQHLALRSAAGSYSCARYGLMRTGTIAQQCRKVMNLSRFPALQDQSNGGAASSVLTRCCCNADTASRDGIGTWFSSTPRSDRIRMFAPSRYARSTSTNRRSIALSRLVFL